MNKVTPIPEGFHTVTPYLMVSDARRFVDFVTRAFDGKQIEFHDLGGGHIHAEVRVGDSMLMIGQAEPSPTHIYLYVSDVDGLYRRAVAAGAKSQEAPTDKPYGDRNCAVIDPSGNTWYIATHVEDVSSADIARRMAANR